MIVRLFPKAEPGGWLYSLVGAGVTLLCIVVWAGVLLCLAP